jgi:DNA polymerase-3 subunit delta
MSVVLLKGDDATLVAQRLQSVIADLIGSGDKSLMVEELTEENYVGADGGPAELSVLVNAAHTPPFLTERRVVVGRNLALFTKADQVGLLVRYLQDPSPTTDLVLVWEKGATSTRLGAVPKSLKTALKEQGAQEIDAAPSGRGRKALLEDRIGDAPLRLDPSARRAIAINLGDDVGRVNQIIEALVSTFGEGARLCAADVEPFLGTASDIPPWDLTDAIDDGNIALALENMHRMTRGGERHPLQIMATLHNNYQRALALDGAPSVSDEKSAALRLGMKGSTFPAKKALTLSRRLGSERLAQVIKLLAKTDLDLRGGSAIEHEAQMEVLIARLARLSR